MEWSIFCNQNKRFKTLMLRSDLCDYSDGYIFVKERITIEGNNDNNRVNKKLALKNVPFVSCISKSIINP